MHRTLQQLTRVRQQLARRTDQCTLTTIHNPTYRSHGASRVWRAIPPTHSATRFSTSAICQAVRTMNLDDLEVDTLDEPKTRQKTSIPPRPSLLSPSNVATQSASEQEASEFFDPTIVAPEQIKEFRDLYEQVRHSKDPDDQEKILFAYRSIADDPDIFSQLQPIDFMYALNSCRNLLKVVPRMRRILEDVEKAGFGNIPEMYHILLKVYVKLSDFKNCGNLVDEMKRKGVDFNTATYHILLDVCRHERSLRNAVGLLAQMRKRNVEVTASTYLIMLTICARVKNARLAREYFDEMPLLGLEQEPVHYNALLNAYAHARNLDGAKQVFRMMEDDGIPVDYYTYTAMIKALKGARRYVEANTLVSSLGANGTKPNAKILVAQGKEPLDIMNECTSNNVEMAQHDFNMLIIQALKRNRFAQVPELMEQMQKRGHRPNVFTFTAMIDADIKMGKYYEAKEIFQAMQQANIQPDVIAYSAMISGALSQASVNESLELLKAMVGDGLLPNLHTFNSLLSASVGEIGIDSLKVIRETMQALHIRPDQRSFNALLSAYALQGDMDEMLRSLEDMKRSKVAPDALTYSILISGFLQNGDLRYAMEWYYKMMDGGFVPATFVFNNLMAALHGSGQGQQVLLMWAEMDRIDIKKNEQSFEIALEACEKFDLHDARPQIEEQLKTYLASRYLSGSKRH
ncbi:hypothetical protein BC939DRAFT_494330 [Gamsiella multidivaricata]|uniref:uncharacterized protein n=1 Tax=Gamsiella multidivaricata TaxID=101098 RepID=UPI00221ED04D|nr:uncharacterized protein BC939DRAFT_494330 [Gamsiella multidivaricata]KAI7820971.1 hypothetical protein BC939DRAFT_494330 [Gamsiella multidivaricata]